MGGGGGGSESPLSGRLTLLNELLLLNGRVRRSEESHGCVCGMCEGQEC